MKKVLYFSRAFGGKSGAAKSALDVLKVLEIENKVHVISSDWKSIIKLLSVGEFRYVAQLIFNYILSHLSTRFLIEMVKPDLLLVNGIISGKYEGLLKTPKLKTAVIVRDGPTSTSGNRKAQSIAAKTAADHLIFLSKFAREAWNKEPAIYNKCYSIGSNYVSFGGNNLNKNLNIDEINQDEKLDIVCIGSIQRRKGQDLLCELARSDNSLSVRFLGGVADSHGHELVKRYNSYQNITFCGHVANVWEDLAAADIMVLPSRGEALPRAVIEAMACGTVVIATNIDGIPDLVDPNHTGYLFPVDDREELKRLVGKYRELPISARRKMSQSARSKYEASFSYDSYRNKWLSIFREIIKE